MEPERQILPSVGTEVPHWFLTWNWSARFLLQSELNCGFFFTWNWSARFLRFVGTEVPIFSWRGTGVQSQCSDLGLAAFFPSLELECGTGVPSETGTPVPTKACDSIGSSQ